jgi:hypothetical protein
VSNKESSASDEIGQRSNDNQRSRLLARPLDELSDKERLLLVSGADCGFPFPALVFVVVLSETSGEL